MPLSPDAPPSQVTLPMCAIFRRFLKRKGLKFTPGRAQVLDSVLGKTAVFAVEELHAELRRAGHRVSMATVYRTLRHLIEAHIVSEVLLDANHAHYQLTFGREPTGHLVCVETHQVIEFSGAELTTIRDRICKEHGFEPLNHRFVIYALSPEGKRMQRADLAEGNE
jgi:Fur family ferric uptake transcriptional regulator